MARKRKPKATTKARSVKQSVRDRYARAREDAQLTGLIATTPEGALRPERVSPSAQGTQSLPALDRQAIRNGWEVPANLKPVVVDRLLEPFLTQETRVDEEGREVAVPPDRYLLKENAKALLQADQRQWERDHPEEAGKAAGAGTTQVNLIGDLAELLKRAEEQRRIKLVKAVEDGDEPNDGIDGAGAEAEAAANVHVLRESGAG